MKVYLGGESLLTVILLNNSFDQLRNKIHRLIEENFLFSVVIPTYNRASFLASTIESVLNQTYNAFELIIVDDGSTDGTAEIIKEYVVQDSRVKYVYQNNKERGSARNLGVSYAYGSWICFLDSDDLYKPFHLEVLARAINAGVTQSILSTRFSFWIDGSECDAPISKLPSGDIQRAVLLRGNPFCCNVCIRKDACGLELFNEDRAYATMEDWIFLFQNVEQLGLLLLSQSTVVMREHSSRSMQNHSFVISQRLLATEFLIRSSYLSKYEISKIYAFTYFFCSVHSHLDSRRLVAFKWLIKASKSGLDDLEVLAHLIRILLGTELIGLLRNIHKTFFSGNRDV